MNTQLQLKYTSGVLLFLFLCFLTVPSITYASIPFSQDPVLLVDDNARTAGQANTHVEFDFNGNLHAAWVDNRLGPNQILGTVMMAGSLEPSTNYRMHVGYTTENMDFAHIHRTSWTTSSLFMLAMNTSTPGSFSFCPADINVTTLPAIPSVTDLAAFSSNAMSGGVVSMVMAGNRLVYAIEYANQILINEFNVATQTWSGGETILGGSANIEYAHPQLAADESGYVYIIFDRHDTSTGYYDVVIQRSWSNTDVLTFQVEHEPLPIASTIGWFDPDIAVTGSYVGSDLIVAIAYIDPDPMARTIWYNHENNGDWTEPTLLSSTPYALNSMSTTGMEVHGPEMAFDADGDSLYVVWADSRSGMPELYIHPIMNQGYTTTSDALLTSGWNIQERPCITTGPDPRNIAISFIGTDGVAFNPFALVLQPDFFDRCDADPGTTGLWDSWGGIDVNFAHIPYSQPACYGLINNTSRGTLLRDFGSVEHTGSLSLQFWDDASVQTSNFFMIMTNDNQRGVIRMLGVRNETTPTNYSYYNGSAWIDSTVPRQTGWRELIMTVNESGTTMQIQYQPYMPGMFTIPADPGMTTFTSLSIEGGDTTTPQFFVDDILVEAIPYISVQPVPATSPLFLGIALVLAGGMITIHRIRRH
ncbi:hypothetical protein JXA80_08015 [bacterium]|nr:hypothetical protein [candidate division CSSED10-310 bacterium]